MKFHRRPTNKDGLTRGALIHALHRQALETSSAMAAIMLIIQANFGTEELNRITQEAEDALP